MQKLMVSRWVKFAIRGNAKDGVVDRLAGCFMKEAGFFKEPEVISH